MNFYCVREIASLFQLKFLLLTCISYDSQFKDKIKSILKNNRGIPAHGLIRLLNPAIRGWSNYQKGICAKSTFAKLGAFMFWQLKRWANISTVIKTDGGYLGVILLAIILPIKGHPVEA